MEQIMPKPRLRESDLRQTAGQLQEQAAIAAASLAQHGAPAARKAIDAATVAFRTGQRLRRVVCEGAGEIGEIIGGRTGRTIATYGARYGLPWLVLGIVPASAEETILEGNPPPPLEAPVPKPPSAP
jgi:hypothetical protein